MHPYDLIRHPTVIFRGINRTPTILLGTLRMIFEEIVDKNLYSQVFEHFSRIRKMYSMHIAQATFAGSVYIAVRVNNLPAKVACAYCNYTLFP